MAVVSTFQSTPDQQQQTFPSSNQNQKENSKNNDQKDTIMNRIATFTFPNYQPHNNITGKPTGKNAGSQVMSSLPLQILLFFNISYSIFWFISMVVMVTWKLMNRNMHWLYWYCTPGMLGLSIIADVLRLRMGFSGNLMERVPELSGLVILTVFPLLITCLYFLAFQQFLTFTLPFEYCVNGIYVVMLALEAIFGYHTAKEVVQMQAETFFLSMNDDNLLLIDSVKSGKEMIRDGDDNDGGDDYFNDDLEQQLIRRADDKNYQQSLNNLNIRNSRILEMD